MTNINHNERGDRDLKFDPISHSQNKNQKESGKSTPKNAGIELKESKELDPKSLAKISDKTKELAQEIQLSMEKSDVSKFQTFLKNSLPEVLYEYFKNLTLQNIANIIAMTLCGAVLIGTGIGIVPVIGSLSIRFGITGIFESIILAGLQRQNSVSAIMGLIPGMKMLAPNTNISLFVNAIRDIAMASGPTILPAVNSLTKSKPQQ